MNELALRGVYFPDFFDRFLNDGLLDRAFRPDVPAVNVKETPAAYQVDLSVPGFAEKDVSVEVDHNVLSISASREERKEDKDAKDRVLRREFATSSFSRSFTLPPNVDTEKVQAKLEHGVLALTLPKKDQAPENKKRKIALK